MTMPVAIVLDFRTPQRTLDCLQSLADEGVDRVVLVENSEDAGATLQAMRAGLDRLRGTGMAIDVLDENRNLGFAAGVNRALLHIREHQDADVLLLNSDARLASGSLEALCDALEGGADVAAPLLVDAAGKLHSPVCYYQPHLAMLTRRAFPGSFSYVTGACVLLSEAVARPGLFDEDFFFYGEDVMLGAMLHAQDKRCVVVETASVQHDGAGSARNGSLFYEYHINRGHLLLARKLPHGIVDSCLSLFGRGLVLPLRAILRSTRFRSLIPMEAFVSAAADIVRSRKKTFTPQVKRRDV